MRYMHIFIKSIFLFMFIAITSPPIFADTSVTSSISSTEAKVEESNLPLRIGTWFTTYTQDPVYAVVMEELVMFDALFEGLVRQTDSGEILPAQASSWTISPDGKRYEFKLRDDIFWTDGKPVVAADFVLGFQRILDKSLVQSRRPTYLLTTIKNANAIIAGEKEPSALGISAPDNKTLVIELNAPAGYFLGILDYPGLVPVPSHMLEKYGEDWWQQRPFVSNGPYRLVVQIGKKLFKLQLRDSETYPNAPKNVDVVAMESLQWAIHKIHRGELDIAWDLRKQQADWMENRLGVQNTTAISAMTTYTVFNTNSPKLKDKRVRKALNLALDRQVIANANKAQKANSLAVPSMLSMADTKLNTPHHGLSYPERLKKARALMREAGYSPDNPLEIDLIMLDRNNLETAALGLRSMFSQIWVKSRLHSLPNRELIDHLESNKYDASIEYWAGDYYDAMTFYHLYHSEGSRNHPRFNNPEYDQLIEAALNEPEMKKRQEIYTRLETILREEVPIVPLSHGNFRVVASPRIENNGLTPLFLAHIYNMSLAQDKPKEELASEASP